MLGTPGLRSYVYLPLAINLVLYSLGLWLAVHYFSLAMSWLMPTWLSWLSWLLWPIFAFCLFFSVIFTFNLVAGLVGAPFYTRLAKKLSSSTEEETQNSFMESFNAEVSRMIYFARWAVPLLIFSIIPGVNVIAPFLWIFFGAWSMSLEYLSYPLEVRGLLFPQQREFAQKNRFETLSLGGAVMFCLSIPFLNILVPPAAVIAASLYCRDKAQNS